ncbi:unnamed protein product [Penicillium bialowiezense]
MAYNESTAADDHDRFFKWAVSNGIQANGVVPCRFPGRGMGMIATRTIEADEIMLTVPVSTMLNIDSIPEGFAARFPRQTSVHGILAAFLTHGDPEFLEKWALWRKIWPSRQDFVDSLPLMWPDVARLSSELGIPLPPSFSGNWSSTNRSARGANDDDIYQNVLVHQTKRLQDSWKNVLTVFPDTDWEKYSFNWFILNTRSFYYVRPGNNPPKDWIDAIGLVPFADYFNHADDAVSIYSVDDTAEGPGLG